MMRRNACTLTLALVLAVSATVAGPMGAGAPLALAKTTTRDVCPGLCAYTSIQAAINDSADGDVIRVAGAPGSVYAEHLTIAKSVQILGGYAGPPGWQRDINAYTTVIDAQGAASVATIAAGSALLEGLTLTGGLALDDGGGLLVLSGSPTISATMIISNTAGSSGGGVAVFGGAPAIISSTVAYNVAMGGGGILIANAAAPMLLATTIANNTGYVTGGGVLIVNGANPVLDACVVRGNHATSGGGVQVLEAAGLITGSRIEQNMAEIGHGGGVLLHGASTTLQATSVMSNTASLDGGGVRSEASSPVIDNCVVGGNQARSGGGLSIVDSLGLITNNTVSANQARGGENGGAAVGGGIALERSAPTVDANTILGNSAADHGGGIDISGRYCPTEMCEDPASATVANSVVARNSAGLRGGGVRIASGTAPDLINDTIAGNSVEGVFIDAYAQAGITNTIVISNGAGIRALVPSAPSVDYNLLWANPQGNYDGLPAGLHDVLGDARFVGAGADNFRLRADSPAIDAALTGAAPGSDRDGNIRPLVGRCGGQQIADIGAYEYLLLPADCGSPTPTATTAVPTTVTSTPTRTASATSTASPVATGTATATATPSRTATPTLTPSTSATRTGTPTATASGTRTQTATPTRTRTPAASATSSQTATPTSIVYTVALPVIVNGFLPECALYEPNDNMDSAWGPLQMNVTYQATLCYFDGGDWYFFETRRAGALAVDLGVPDLAADLSLHVHAADGALLASSQNAGEGVDESIVVVLQAGGRYYIRVEPVTRRDANQPYKLKAGFY